MDEFAVTRGVCPGCVLAATLNLFFNVDICLTLGDGQQQGRGVRVAYLHDGKLVGNHRKLHLEPVVSDLEYAEDRALVDESLDDFKAMLGSECISVL